MVVLSVLLLPALILMPATNVRAMLIIDLPLCLGTTGSLAAFYAMAERAQGRRRWDAIRQLPALLALGAGLAPHLSKAVFEGLGSMAGEFVRTPKKGEIAASGALRYRARADIPFTETALCIFSLASVVASLETGHWFADAVRHALSPSGTATSPASSRASSSPVVARWSRPWRAARPRRSSPTCRASRPRDVTAKTQWETELAA